MSQASPTVSNGTGQAVRLGNNDYNNASLSCHSGTARPSYAVLGTIWLNTTNNTLYFFDGTDDIPLDVVDAANNRVSRTLHQLTLTGTPSSSGHAVNISYLTTQLDSRPNMLSRSLLATGGGTPANGGEFQLANISSAAYTSSPIRLFEVFCMASDGSGQRGEGVFTLNATGEPQMITQSGIVNIAAGHNWATPHANFLLVGREATGNKLVIKNTTTVDLRVFVRMT